MVHDRLNDVSHCGDEDDSGKDMGSVRYSGNLSSKRMLYTCALLY